MVTAAAMSQSVVLLVVISVWYPVLVLGDTTINKCDVEEPPCLTSQDKLVYGGMMNGSEYKLKAYQDSQLHTWPLYYYVQMARKLIVSFNRIDWEIVVGLHRTFTDGGQFDIPGTVMNLVKMEPVAVVGMVFGVVVALLLLVSGPCVCCCRCCCKKCGAKLSVEDAEKQTQCGCMMVAMFLLVCCVMLVVGIGSIYTVGDRFPQMSNFTISSVSYCVDDIVSFKGQLFDQIEKITGEDLDFSVDVLLHKIENMADDVVGPFMIQTRPVVRALLSSILALQSGITGIGDSLGNVASTVSDIETINTQLSTELSDIGDTMTTLIAACKTALGDGHVACVAAPDLSVVPIPHDFSNVPSIADQASLLSDASSLDLSSIVSLANNTFEDLPRVVTDNADNIVSDIRHVLGNITESIGPMLNGTETSINNGLASVVDQKSIIDDFAANTIDPYMIYGRYVFWGVAGVVALVLLPALLGCLCGSCAYRGRPEERKKIGACAHCCLMTSSCFSVFVGFFYLLLGAILFFVGANFTMLCQGLLDLSIFKNFIDKPEYWNSSYHLSAMLFGNGSYKFPIEDVLLKCQNNTAMYEALRLHKLMDIENVVDLESQLPDLDPLENIVRGAVADLNLIDNSTKSTLDDMVGSGAVNMDVTDMMSGLQDGLSTLSLTNLKTKLLDQATLMDGLSSLIANQYRDVHAQVDNIDTVTLPQLSEYLDYMVGNLSVLQSQISSLMSSTSGLVADVVALESSIKGPGVNIVLDLKNEVGQCQVVYDIYMGSVNTICVFFLDAFNGLWLSVCICGFFSAITFGVSLGYSKYVRLTSGAARYTTERIVDIEHRTPHETAVEMKELIDALGDNLTPAQGYRYVRLLKVNEDLKPSRMSSVRLSTVEEDRLVNRLKNTNLDKFHTLCKMHLSFLLHLPGSSLEDFLGDSGPNSPAGTMTPTTEKNKLHFRHFGKKKNSKENKSPNTTCINQEMIEQVLPLVDHLSVKQNLKHEGIFRKSGHIGRQKLLREKLSNGEDLHLELESGVYSAHDCANVLKSCLSDLTEPVLTDRLYQAFCQVSRMEHQDKQLQTLQLLLQLLPSENFFLIRCLMTLLHKVSQESLTKMTSESLGTLFVPHLLVPRCTSPQELHSVVSDLTKTVALMISKTSQLFKIPSALLRDIAAYWSEMEETTDTDCVNSQPTETPRIKYKKRLSPSDVPIRTSVTFTDRQASQEAAGQTDTQVALAQLYAHVSAMPQSSKKRKLMKQFNRANGVVLGSSPVPSENRHKRTKSLGNSIKKIVARNHKRSGSSQRLNFYKDEEEHVSFKPLPGCRTDDSASTAPSQASKTPSQASKTPSSPLAHIVDMKENINPRTPLRKRHFYCPESPACTPTKELNVTPKLKANFSGPYMSPITRTISKAPLSVQACVMTPGSRAAVAMLLTP